MKAFLLTALLLTASLTQLAAQGRFSLAPTVWFNYSPYTYRATLTYGGVSSLLNVAGYELSPALGLMARYQLTPQWDLATGVQWYAQTNYPTRANSPYGSAIESSSRGYQVPILLSYRFTQRRFSPYGSAGVLLQQELNTEVPLRTNGLVGLGIDYRFHSGLSLQLQPTAGYRFTRPVSDTYLEYSRYRLLSVGLQAQLIWHL